MMIDVRFRAAKDVWLEVWTGLLGLTALAILLISRFR